MPDATVSQETYHRDLKTLQGAWVELRQLPYHDMLIRRDKGSVASLEQQENRRRRGEQVTPKMTIETLQTWERDYMFKNCIADHNLEDKNGVKLDFNSPMALKMLRPDIGLEIEQMIDELNVGGEVDGNFQTAPTSSTEPARAELLTLPSTDTQKNS